MDKQNEKKKLAIEKLYSQSHRILSVIKDKAIELSREERSNKAHKARNFLKEKI